MSPDRFFFIWIRSTPGDPFTHISQPSCPFIIILSLACKLKQISRGTISIENSFTLSVLNGGESIKGAPLLIRGNGLVTGDGLTYEWVDISDQRHCNDPPLSRTGLVCPNFSTKGK